MFLLIPLGIVLLVLGVGGIDTGAARSAPEQSILRLTPKSDDDAFPTAYDAIDALESGTVLRIRVKDFAEYTEGVAAQCVHRAKAFECGNAFPVQFDADGKAFFQYQLRDDFHANAVAGGRCRADAARCTLVVHDAQRNTTAVIDTVFHDRLPDARQDSRDTELGARRRPNRHGCRDRLPRRSPGERDALRRAGRDRLRKVRCTRPKRAARLSVPTAPARANSS